MKDSERLILAKILTSSLDQTIPDTFRMIEMIEQRPLTDAEREEVKEHVK